MENIHIKIKRIYFIYLENYPDNLHGLEHLQKNYKAMKLTVEI